MIRLAASGLCAGLLIGLAACGQQSGGDGNQAAVENNQASSNQMAMNDPNNPFARSEMGMHDRMMAATGANVSETWARKMIEHHRGAVEMSQILLAQDPNSRFAPMARTTIEEQTAEIQRLEQMIRNAGAAATEPASPSAASAPTASRPKAEPKAAPKTQAKEQSKAAPKVAPKAAPKEQPKAADPKAPASGNTCTAEHRALGHC